MLIVLYGGFVFVVAWIDSLWMWLCDVGAFGLRGV